MLSDDGGQVYFSESDRPEDKVSITCSTYISAHVLISSVMLTIHDTQYLFAAISIKNVTHFNLL